MKCFKYSSTLKNAVNMQQCATLNKVVKINNTLCPVIFSYSKGNIPHTPYTILTELYILHNFFLIPVQLYLKVK